MRCVHGFNLESMKASILLHGFLPSSPLMLALGLACCLCCSVAGCLRRLRGLQAQLRGEYVCARARLGGRSATGMLGKAAQSSVWGSALHNRTQAINNASATELCPRKPNFPVHTQKHISMQKPQEARPHLCLLSSVSNQESQPPMSWGSSLLPVGKTVLRRVCC